VAHASPEDLLGAVVDGRYTLRRQVGQGGFGLVFQAEDLYGTPCAIKLIPFAHWADRSLAQREAARLEELAHPGLIGFRGAGRFGPTAGGYVYIAMELGEGSLHERLSVGGPLPLGEVKALVLDLLDALDHLHARGIVHGDVKPGNLIRAGDKWKLCDLGSACAAVSMGDPQRVPHPPPGPAGGRETGRDPRWSGTPEFMAPEAFEGEVGPPADLWSVGLLVHECVTGKRPFAAEGAGHEAMARLVRETDPVLAAGLSAPLAMLIRACLERDPARRLTSAGLRQALAGDLGEVPRPARGRRGWVGAALIWGAAAAALAWEVARG
jgi:serine/threonine protein kinase